MAIYLIEESKGSKTSSEYGVVDYTPRKGKGVKWDLVDRLIDAVKKLEIPGFSLKGACLDRDAVQVYPACTEEEFTKHMNSLKSSGLKAYRNGVYTTGDLYMIMEPASDEDSIILYLYPKDGEDIAGASEESLTEDTTYQSNLAADAISTWIAENFFNDQELSQDQDRRFTEGLGQIMEVLDELNNAEEW